MDWKERITIQPAICHGKPCIKGTRIWVSLILDFMANGDSVDDILQSYPHLSREDIQACMAYGAEAARERFIPIPLSAAHEGLLQGKLWIVEPGRIRERQSP